MTINRLMSRRLPAAWLLAAALTTAAAPAQAHDSWFALLTQGRAGTLLALGTGNRFPVFEFGIEARYLVKPGCRDGAGAPLALEALRDGPAALWLRSSADASSCWAQLSPFEVDLPNDKIALYIDEVRPPPAMLAAWEAMRARGLPWHERYTKHARVALPAADGSFGAAAAMPAPMGMDLLLEREGGELRFQLLRDGQPLPGLALELQSADSQTPGRWLRSDAQGRLKIATPGAGRWLLRGIDLRLAIEQPNQPNQPTQPNQPNQPERFDSRFITLAFELR